MPNIVQKIPLPLALAGETGQLEKGWKEINQPHLINTLNHINFLDGDLQVNFKHIKYNKIVSFKAKPQPCFGKSLRCQWSEPFGLGNGVPVYEFLNFILSDGLRLFLVEAELEGMDDQGLSFSLPTACYEVSSRKVKRHLCKGIQVQFVQNGVAYYGTLVDFSAVSFRVELITAESRPLLWINPTSTVNVLIKHGQDIQFSGPCDIIRQGRGQMTRSYVLRPLNHLIQRFKPKEFRSLRQQLSPAPNIVFRHPFTDKMVSLAVVDLSGSGFAVEEHYHGAVLVPGLIIPEIGLECANNFILKCKAQVVYCNRQDEAVMRCGLAILDMDIQDQIRLSTLLHQAGDRNSHICAMVDLDVLWNFFFETGFVYPKKYAYIQANKEKFKDIYERLYTQNPDIAINFIYQDKNAIYGHMSMFRYYENTWIIHHHAAITASHNRAGVVVLEQIGRFINETHHLPAAHMNFVACYFRPDNKFPNLVFGGVARKTPDAKGCSLDPFAYFHVMKSAGPARLPAGWTLTEAQAADLVNLKIFYEYQSGGLMLTALDLEPELLGCNELSLEYQRLGFKRERQLLALKMAGRLKAIIMVNISDIGLNMSNITNCMHVIILDGDGLEPTLLAAVLARLSGRYEEEDIPVLLYPVAYADRNSLPYEKTYNLWVLNMEYTDHYFGYLDKLLHRQSKNIAGGRLP